MKVEASAPSNIALIKYMGKRSGNVPTNASLSLTLEHLRSFVTIESGGDADRWQPLQGFPELHLSETGRSKFLAHFASLKQEWGVAGFHMVSSANNFPSDCGLASSASSFAALTLATYALAQRVRADFHLDQMTLSRAARRGSGSSCRSLFSPWALWRGEGAEPVALPVHLEHAVVIVGAERKAISSSTAHQRVTSSLLFTGRPERAEMRLQALLKSLQAGAWQDSFEVCWSEFFDMHALFATSQPSFGYMSADSFRVLQHLRGIWEDTKDGPLITMDAGANIHLLLRPEQVTLADQWLKGFSALKSWVPSEAL